MYRTGLMIEMAEAVGDIHGTRVTRRRVGKVLVTDIRVSSESAKLLGKPKGRYITVDGEPQEHAVSRVLEKALEQFLPWRGTILVAGLGNPDVTRDSLGSACVSRLLTRKGERRRLVAVETDIGAKTGIETARMVRAIAREMNVTCVLAIDALACADPRRIGRTVQLSDTGIQPGSGVHTDSPALTSDFVGVPVVAIGVPMVSELFSVTGEPSHKGLLAAPPDEDVLAALWAEAIAGAVNSLSV